AKQVIWMGLGMLSICSMLYRAPQIVEAVDVARAGGAPLSHPVAKGDPSESISGLLRSMGERPLTDAGDEAPAKTDADDLRVFSAEALTSEQRQEIAKQAARLMASEAKQTKKPATVKKAAVVASHSGG
ncbi:MAG: hypothetical protein J0L61_04920, partial [Planctomycetes bacterium]|nr:hypothetical protein [Planctomycetota bacterium]